MNIPKPSRLGLINSKKISARVSEVIHNAEDMIEGDTAKLFIDKLSYGLPENDENEYIGYSDEVTSLILTSLESIEQMLPLFFYKANEIQCRDLYLVWLDTAVEIYQEDFESSGERLNPANTAYAIKIIETIIGEMITTDMPSRFESLATGAIQEINGHKRTFQEKRRYLIKTDSYGFEDNSEWEKEKTSFCRKIFKKSGVDENDPMFKSFGKIMSIGIEAISIISEGQDPPEGIEKSNHSKGVLYEKDCLSYFRDSGWTCIETPSSGDKGVDIIASKNGIRLSIQCKNWSEKIDTSAVQEIVSAGLFYETDFSIILCENGCTRQALEISNKIGVTIIRQSEIPLIETILIRKIIK